MEEWKEYKLGEIFDFNNGLSKGGKFFGHGYDFVSFKTVFKNHFLPNTLDDLVESSKKEREKFSVKEGDVFLTRTSETQNELAYSCVALKDYPNATYNGFTKRLRPNGKIKIDSIFSAYFFRSAIFRNQVTSMSNMVTRASLSNEMLDRMSIKIPSYDLQKTIGKILFSFDAKIQLNKRINDNLEQQAQALFKSWFVDFEPFKDGEFVNSEFGMIPKGWRTGVLSDIIEILSGFAFKSNTFEFEGKYKLVTIKAVQDGYLELNGADGINDVPVKVPRHCFLKKKDILLSLTGNVGRCCLVNSDNLLLNQRVAKIEPKKIADWAYTYILFRLSDTKTYLETISRGTAQANLSPIETANMPILIPTREVMDAFSVCATPLVNYSMVLTIEAEKLAQQRDTLLPKLMSGELKINDLTR
jgi:type I restriction enzyme S subunit